jgi:2-phospho-L-lactate guanylyltransferase
LTEIAGWTAIIPFKPAGARKTRLANRLSPAQRDVLAEKLFWRLAGVLGGMTAFSRVALLSSMNLPGWDGVWWQDAGRGLNAELQHHSLGLEKLLVIHADLPLVSQADISTLLAQAQDGCAVAPDRHGTGTNALALCDVAGFTFSFGEGSLQRHIEAAKTPARIVTLPGFSLDIDTPEDIDLARQLGAELGG